MGAPGCSHEQARLLLLLLLLCLLLLLEPLHPRV
jgi:hypothetical protein